MDVEKMFPSRFLKGAELRGPVTVTIASVRAESAYKPGQGQVDVYVLWCQGAKRGIVLSRPLALSVSEALGEPDTDRWSGKSITLYPLAMRVAGRDLIAIRARAPQPAPTNGNGKAES